MTSDYAFPHHKDAVVGAATEAEMLRLRNAFSITDSFLCRYGDNPDERSLECCQVLSAV